MEGRGGAGKGRGGRGRERKRRGREGKGERRGKRGGEGGDAPNGNSWIRPCFCSVVIGMGYVGRKTI